MLVIQGKRETYASHEQDPDPTDYPDRRLLPRPGCVCVCVCVCVSVVVVRHGEGGACEEAAAGARGGDARGRGGTRGHKPQRYMGTGEARESKEAGHCARQKECHTTRIQRDF